MKSTSFIFLHERLLFRRVRKTGGIWFSFPAFLTCAARAQVNTNEIPQIRPFHGELPPTFFEAHGTALGGTVVLVIATSALVLWWLNRPRPAPVIPPAMEARAELTNLPADVSDGVKLSRISQILRRYLQRAFALPPGELTTTEFCQALGARTDLGSDLTLSLAEFLRENDRRKFSGTGERPDSAAAAAAALNLIEKSEARQAALSPQPTGELSAPRPG